MLDPKLIQQMEMLLIEEIPASSIDINDVLLPELIDKNRSLTLNGTGHVFYPITPVGQRFIDEEATANKTVIEIGSGYSNLAIEALKKGILNYVANDISLAHLKILVKRVCESIGSQYLVHLKLLHAKAPDQLPVFKQKYDAILADKVMHFMNPEEIIDFLTWCKTVLKEDGTLYITVASPYSKAYHKMLPDYERRKQEGASMPGHFKNMMRDMDITFSNPNNQKYSVPDEMVLFSREDLIQLCEKQGLQIIASYSLKIPDEDENEWICVEDTQSRVVGVVAKKL